MTVNQPTLTLGSLWLAEELRWHCVSFTCWQAGKWICKWLASQVVPNVLLRLHHACLLLFLKLRLALAQSNYHPRLAVSTGTPPHPPYHISYRTALFPHLQSGALLFWPLSGGSLTLAVLDLVLIMQTVKPHESLLPQHGTNKHEPLVFYYKDTCQAAFSLISRDI